MRKVVTTNVVMFAKAIADPTRWRVIRLVRNEALCVCELADILEMPQSSVSSHVQIIRGAGLLESEKCEKWTYFRIRREFIGLLEMLEGSFPAQESVWKRDGKMAKLRLSQRRESCCPGPERLATGKAGNRKARTSR